VLLLHAKDSAFVKGCLSKDDGSYAIPNVDFGTYICQISMIGFAKKYSNVFQISPQSLSHNLGK
jgi:hypothetical protein